MQPLDLPLTAMSSQIPMSSVSYRCHHTCITPTVQLLQDSCAGMEEKNKGAFVRKESQHRNWIKADGSTAFAPKAGRYHLYVANGCPWCHRSVQFSTSLVMMGLLYVAYPDGCRHMLKVCPCACACLQVPSSIHLLLSPLASCSLAGRLFFEISHSRATSCKPEYVKVCVAGA